MPVNVQHSPAERSPFVRYRLKLKHITNAAEALNLVVVHDGYKIIKPVMRSEKYCFPRRAFVQLAVAQHYEDAIVFVIMLSCESNPAANRESVTERACRSFNAGHISVRDVAAKLRVILAIGLKPTGRKEAALCQNSIDNSRAVPFAQNETITIRPMGSSRINS